MLAGFQEQVDSLFPAIRTLTPSDAELKAGAEKLKCGKTVVLSAYKTEVFDMHVTKDRNAYTKRMLDLSQRAQIGTVRILIHDRQVMHRKDGSTGWFGYLEWMEYDRKAAESEND